MSIELDHIMIPSRNSMASAKQLAELLAVPWGKADAGPFVAVYVNDALTLDFDEWGNDAPRIHYCFRVDDADFDTILGLLKSTGIAYRSSVHGPVDFRIGNGYGGRMVYWNEPDDHQWEMLTVSYARQSEEDKGRR